MKKAWCLIFLSVSIILWPEGLYRHQAFSKLPSLSFSSTDNCIMAIDFGKEQWYYKIDYITQQVIKEVRKVY
jgi:hypothetical protein